MTNPSASADFARQLLAHYYHGGSFSRADATAFLDPVSRDLTWTEQKERAERWLGVLVGAGVLELHDHVYTLVRWAGNP